MELTGIQGGGMPVLLFEVHLVEVVIGGWAVDAEDLDFLLRSVPDNAFIAGVFPQRMDAVPLQIIDAGVTRLDPDRETVQRFDILDSADVSVKKDRNVE